MSDTIHQKLCNAVISTFEEMAFLDAIPVDVHLAPAGNEVAAVSLLLHDPLQAELRLEIPHITLQAITQTIYNNQEDDEQLEKDVLSELINTISGLFFNDFFPADQTFKLGLPVIERPDNRQLDSKTKIWHFRIDTEHDCCIMINGELSGVC